MCSRRSLSLSYESPLSHLLERASPSTILRYIASGSGRLLSLRRLAASLAMKGSHLEGAVAPVGDASSKASDGGGGRSGGDGDHEGGTLSSPPSRMAGGALGGSGGGCGGGDGGGGEDAEGY